MKTAWDILDIEPTMEERDIKRAYAKRLRAIGGPEKGGEIFAELREAYEVACEAARTVRAEQDLDLQIDERGDLILPRGVEDLEAQLRGFFSRVMGRAATGKSFVEMGEEIVRRWSEETARRHASPEPAVYVKLDTSRIDVDVTFDVVFCDVCRRAHIPGMPCPFCHP